MAESTPESGDEPSDLVLMERSGRGETAAFAALVERHQFLVVGTIARMLGDAAEAEDIAQQVFLRVWKSASRYRPQARFTTWLLTITRNLVFNEMRRRKRSPVLPTLDPEGEPPPGTTEAARGPDAVLLQGELERAVRAAIAQLPEQQRLALILRRYDELSYEEIAEVLEQSVPGVKSLLFRARTELRQRLASYLEN